ncbi:hypothetical protein Pan5_40 [Pseudanabaena phage Pan5]|nr:hypothetical protein Pan5_40 [Pseudanabaena phage Pan5]
METLQFEEIQTGVVKMNVTDTEIAKMKAEFLPLAINGIDDKAGFKRVYDARQEVKRTRVSLTKYAKGLREDAQEWVKRVIAEEKRVVGELTIIEDHLQSEEDKIEAEKARIKAEEEAKEAKRIQDRIDALAAYGFQIDYTTIKSIDDQTFNSVLENAKAEHAKELERKAEEERQRLAEEARLKAEREELERLRQQAAEAQRIIDEKNEQIRKEQEAKEAALRAEQERIEAEKKAAEAERQRLIDEKKRQEELEAAKLKAAEEARLKAIEDAKIESARLEQEKKLREESAARELALRPDKEKLQAFANKIGSLIDFEVKDEKAQLIVNDIAVMIGKMQKHILTKIKEL